MLTEEARIDEIREKARQALEQRSIPWQNSQSTLPVINISVDDVLLNTNSHRIRSQRESHPDTELLRNDPFCERAQEIVADFLRETPGFEALKDNLAERGQVEPGIVTHKGILINGNTRAVALRDLDKKYIRVVILPSDATEREIYELEAQLQLAREYKQEYTLTNELLFIQEQLDHGTSKEELAIKLGKAQSRNRRHLKQGVDEIDKSIRMLQMIREMQDLSGNTIRLTWFDPHYSALSEADAAFMKLRDRDPAQAERVRQGRMTGMLVGTPYRSLRLWDGDDFVTTYVMPEFHEADALLEAAAASTPGAAPTSDLGVEWLEDDDVQNQQSAATGYDTALFLRLAAQYHAAEDQREVMPGVTKEILFEQLDSVITSAAQDKDLERRGEKRRLSPIRLLRDARRAIGNARTTLDRAQNEPGFEIGTLKYEIKRTLKELEEFAKSIGAR